MTSCPRRFGETSPKITDDMPIINSGRRQAGIESRSTQPREGQCRERQASHVVCYWAWGDHPFPPHFAHINLRRRPFGSPLARCKGSVRTLHLVDSKPTLSIPYPYLHRLVRYQIMSRSPLLHQRPRWCKLKTTMHHVIKRPNAHSVEYRNKRIT